MNAERQVHQEVGYKGAHARVTRELGQAGAHDCQCGEPAVDWHYGGGDPRELRDERGRPYSTSSRFYRPLCRRCHRQADRSRMRALAPADWWRAS